VNGGVISVLVAWGGSAAIRHADAAQHLLRLQLPQAGAQWLRGKHPQQG
jgi:hypothetical protein